MPPSPPAAQTIRSRRRIRRGVVWVLATGAVVLSLVCWAVAEPFWLRPLVQRHVRAHAGRQVDFDGAEFRIDSALRPVLRLRHLTIENAAWASRRPLTTAAEVAVTFDWRSLVGGDAVLPRVVLSDADIDLEQQADGLRNWRLSDPQDRGPGKVRIESLEAFRSRLQVIHRGQDLQLALATEPLAADERLAAHPELPLTQSLQVSGRHRDTRFDGRFAVGTVFGLSGGGPALPLRGALQSNGSSLALEGVVQDLLTLGGFDLAAHLVSPDLAASAVALFGSDALPALAADGRVRLQKASSHWQASGLQLRVGRSDVAGSFDVDRRQPDGRPLLRAKIEARHLDLEDLRRGFVGRSDAAISGTSARSDRTSPRRVDGLDVEADLTAARVSGVAPNRRWADAEALKLHASWQGGQLAITPLAFSLAGGAASGRLTVDRLRQPNEIELNLGFSGLQLDRLVDTRSKGVGLHGGLNLQVGLRAQGGSLPAWRDTASGQVSASLLQASLPASLAARLALDGGQWLRALASPGKQVPVTCSVADMRIDSGLGHTTRLAIETDDLLVTGSARIDLKRKSYDLVLTPHRKHAALLALDKSVRLSGGRSAPKVGLVDRSAASGPVDCHGPATAR